MTMTINNSEIAIKELRKNLNMPKVLIVLIGNYMPTRNWRVTVHLLGCTEINDKEPSRENGYAIRLSYPICRFPRQRRLIGPLIKSKEHNYTCKHRVRNGVCRDHPLLLE